MVVAQGSSGSIKRLRDAPAAAHDKMGIVKKIVITKEPDMNRTVKKIVQMKAPCAAEMAALMDCFRRYASGQSDSACAQHRQALALCAQTSKRANASATKSRFYEQLQRLAGALKRSGY